MEQFQQPTGEPATPETPEAKEGPLGYAALEEIVVNGRSVLELLQVMHNRATWEQYNTHIAKYLDRAEVLVLEMAVFKPDTEENNLTDLEAFYSHLTQAAQDRGIPVIVADPEKDVMQAIVNNVATIVPSIAALGSSVYAYQTITDLANKLSVQQRYKYKPTPDVTRRELLKFGAASAVAVVGGLHFSAALAEELGVGKEKGELLETMLLSALDYRNALVAKQILELSDTHRTISAVYGYGHTPGLKKYLSNPELLEEKLALYKKTFGLFNDDVSETYLPT